MFLLALADQSSGPVLRPIIKYLNKYINIYIVQFLKYYKCMIELFNVLGKQRKCIVGYFFHQLIQVFFIVYLYLLFIFIKQWRKWMEVRQYIGWLIYASQRNTICGKDITSNISHRAKIQYSTKLGFSWEKNSSQTENYLRTMISISSALIPQWFPGDGQFVSETFLLKQIKPTRGTIEDWGTIGKKKKSNCHIGF